jgi:hypothetical protein
MADAAKDDKPAAGERTAAEYRDVSDKLRARVDLFGKTLAAIATLGTTAVGLDKIGDLFPADDDGGLVALGCVALVLAALAAIGVAVRLMRVARPAFIHPDLTKSSDLDENEKRLVRPVFEVAANRFGYTSLPGLQERERSLRDAAGHASDKDERARRTALADEVGAAIEQALAQAQVVTVRQRATDAIGGGSWALYVVVLAGLIGFALCADKVSSDRTDSIAQAKACGEARKAGATAKELGNTNDICEASTGGGGSSATPTAADARAQVAAKLVESAELCASLQKGAGKAADRPLTSAECQPARNAAAILIKGP